jgi:hypothetical protein
MRRGAILLLAGALLLGADAACAQPGAPVQSPPPAGLSPGTGAAFPKGQGASLDALPDWGGIWFYAIVPGPRPAGPKLKGRYKAAHDAYLAEVAASNGVVKNGRSPCSPPGMPGFMAQPQYPYEFLFTPGRVTINQEAWMQTRKIWTDGRSHQEDPDPSYAGDSIGHWEGDTLVAETIAIKDTLELQRGMTHSPRMKLTERIRLKPGEPDVLINEMTIEDPDALEEPWRTTMTYRRDRHGALFEFQCSENDRNPVDEEGNVTFE